MGGTLECGLSVRRSKYMRFRIASVNLAILFEEVSTRRCTIVRHQDEKMYRFRKSRRFGKDRKHVFIGKNML